jgi:hypothetical protein
MQFCSFETTTRFKAGQGIISRPLALVGEALARGWVAVCYRTSKRATEMRFFVAFLIVLTVLYFWDTNSNNGRLTAGVQSMGRQISHNFGY